MSSRLFQVLAEQCDTCIFRPGNLMRLRRGRVQSMVRACVAEDAHIFCHETMTYEDEEAEDYDDPGALIVNSDSPVCRGFYDAYPGVGQLRRIAERLGAVEFVNPKVTA